MGAPRRGNRGPGAAAENRRALVAAAVEVFAEQGYDAPLSAVARRAGVGQGSLYRHFPDRVALALTVFEDNVVELEALAARPGTGLDDLLDRITEQTVHSVAFVRVVTAGVADARLDAVVRRVRAVVEGALDGARRSGAVRDDVGTDEVLLAVGMVAAHVATVPATDRRTAADAAWALLHGGLRPGADQPPGRTAPD